MQMKGREPFLQQLRSKIHFFNAFYNAKIGKKGRFGQFDSCKVKRILSTKINSEIFVCKSFQDASKMGLFRLKE
ncbi:MAG TPA: hypothetical protein DDY18_08055 [Flavobacterium sp.]|nr:hypothetical protein [Flavobacterium sp.]